MSTTPNSSLYSSTNNSTSTLRPRNARLISYLDDGGSSSGAGDGTGATSTSTSTATSRGVSPAANSRSVTAMAKGSSRNPPRSVPEDLGRRPSSGLWDSWSQLQGIASTILGNDAPSTAATRSGTTPKSPAWMKQEHTYTTGKGASKWGPRAPSKTTTEPGSIEDRQAMLQARKREALLLAATEAGRDASGRFKRKGSNSSLTHGSPIMDPTEDALVYRHKVQSSDTMAGVTIKYNCQPEVFRKVNRLWPNDRIQIRAYVLLPVDACAIRGKKVDNQHTLEALGREQLVHRDGSSGGTNTAAGKETPPGVLTTSTELPVSALNDSEGDYKHDSWVMLPNFDHPVEILRISRSTLGYFPPAQRKSNHHLSSTASVDSSPRTSFDTLRHPPTHAAQQAQLHQQQHRSSLSLNASPVRRPADSSRHRSTSTNSSLSTSATNHSQGSGGSSFLKALHGPGGVGTLRGLRTEISRPGPAEDSLNQRFPYLAPMIAPPAFPSALQPEYRDFPSTGLGSRAVSLSMVMPRASTDSMRSTRSARSNSSVSAGARGAVAGMENWVKKIAGTGRPGVNRTNSDRSAMGLGGIGIGIGGETGLGDLIELESSTELLDLGMATTDWGSEQRGREVRNLDEPGEARKETNDEEETPKLKSAEIRPDLESRSDSVRREEEILLNERFPVRGRVTRAYAGD